ncbi:DUF808 family protein [Mucilaginibacter sabulilitoris]|uniref:DUF808 family protein n=1 Tax=Mucilaginibacter sabulilitoris TaxID=1173583 RepID=A0ABZ0TRA9_9SPHI|nr:DUF808 family protein [Mucilaginibacter sabulilitoris]WPU95657.1 DUF808 family protein [Mucilaginibacter sabulilitoris]
MIIVPIALLLNAFFPVAIKIILVLGGLYLAFEGVEKIIEYLFHRSKVEHQGIVAHQEMDAAAENAKVKSCCHHRLYPVE